MFATQITDKDKFYAIVAAAVAATESSKLNTMMRMRWVSAIANAVREIEENGEFLHYDVANTQLVMWSQGSNNIYAANGVCQCRAYTLGMERNFWPYPCRHRAAARLFRNYFGLAESGKPLPTERVGHHSTALYLKPTNMRKAERVGGIRVN